METLFAVIFVQGFIWGALLLRKRRSAETLLGLAFLVLGVICFLEYSKDVYQIQVPVILIFGGILLLLIAIDMVSARSSGAVTTTEEESREAKLKKDISIFYMFLYLCALEISPLVLLYRWLEGML